jgi:oligo-1,6-glucosidase
VLSFYKMMSAMRKEHKDVFVYGTFELLDSQGKGTFMYRKHYEGKTAVVVLNFTAKDQTVPNELVDGLTLLVSSYRNVSEDALQPLEGRIYVDY